MADTAAPTGIGAPPGGVSGGGAGGTNLSADQVAFNQEAAAKVANNQQNALIATSSGARAMTADNVTKLQGITTPPATQSTDTTGSTTKAPAGNTLDDATARSLFGTDMTGVTKNADGSYTPDASAISRVKGGAAPSGAGGTGSDTTADPYDSAVATITDPGLKAQYKSTLQNLDTQINTAHANIDAIGQRSLNDPAATAMVAQIKAKYEQAENVMKLRNNQVVGKANTSVAAFGGLGIMSQDFLNNQQSLAEQRLTDIQAREDEAVSKAQIAYQTNNFKELNAAMTSFDAANKEKLGALSTLLSETNKKVAQDQAQQKIDATADKNAKAYDITYSTKIAPDLVAQIAESGVTDAATIKKHIQEVAAMKGIDPDVLAGAVETARQTLLKTDTTVANSLDTITNRDAGTKIKQENADTAKARAAAAKAKGTGGKFNVSDEIKALTPHIDNARDSSGHVPVDQYLAGRAAWMGKGGTATSYNSNFKSYLDPKDYTKAGLPASATVTTIIQH